MSNYVTNKKKNIIKVLENIILGKCPLKMY